MLSQLGYVCLFSSAFPLAAMAALLGNLLELRGDAFKLCFVLQRPFGRRVSNIGTWQVSGRIDTAIFCFFFPFFYSETVFFENFATKETDSRLSDDH